MIDLSFVKQNKKLVRLAAIILAILLIDFIFILRGQITYLTKTIFEVNKLKRNIQTAKKDIASEDSLKKQHARLILELPKKQKQAISEEEIPSLLTDISKIAKSARVRIMQIRPLDSRMEQVKSAEDKKYFTLPIELNLKCDYHHLGIFLNKLETAERYISVLDLDITSVKQAPYEYPVKMTIETLIVKQ